VVRADAANDQEAATALGSHIASKGHYAIREVEKETWIIEVMPRVRIGPAESPWTLSPPVKYPLNVEEPKFALDADSYNQIVERVHSAVATEVYRQIEIDVRNKITVFPTAYLRAVALGYEA